MSDDRDTERWRSRTDLAKERKAAEERLAGLAQQLVGLSDKQLSKVPLDDATADAVLEARRISSRIARARQLRVVRRCLRDGDSEPIFAAVRELLSPSGDPSPAQWEARQWRERLLAGGDEAVARFVAEHAAADRRQLRSLLRNARQGAAAKSGAKALARLEQVLLQSIAASTSAAPDETGSEL